MKARDWTENTLLPLVCAFGLGIAVMSHARDVEREAEATATPVVSYSYSECPPYGYPETRPTPEWYAQIEAQP